MQKIKTVQPYKLYKKILKDRSKAKFALIGAVVVLLSSMVFDPDLGLVLVPLFLILSIPLTIYNPKLKAEYEPGVSYKYFRNYKNLQSKLPKALLDKEEQMRLENHQDVDFNVKVDLNDIYGVTDKLVMSYQNFSYEKKKMEDGDYLLGISPQGVYYVSKNQAVTKTKINFGDIDTLGLLAGIGNVFVFHIISKQNDEINIIVDQNDSLLVSPFMLFSALLKLLDDYILNGGVVANPSSKRRVVVSSGVGTSSGSTSASTQDATNNNRVIDLSYSTGVLEDMRTATFVGSNRQIEVDEHVTSKVVNESPDTPVVNRPSNETVSNRNIDLDDLIGSHITDAHRDYNETKTPLVQPVQVFQARTEIPQDETPKVENLEIETSQSSAPVIETPAVETSRNKTSQVDVSEIGTTKPEQPKKKSKTGLIIGVVLAVVLVIAVVAYFMLNNKKQERLLAEKEAYYEQQLAEQQRIQEEQQALYEAELEAQKTQLEEQPIRVYSNAYDGFVNIRQEPQSKSPILGVLKNGPEGAILLGTEGEWKKIDCNGIVGYVYEKYVQDTPTEVYEYWGMLRKDASNYRFTENDLSPLTAKELTYLRNSVYAKHGYVFNSQELNNYFKRISWYHPDASVTEAVLNGVERANVEFIKNYQERNGKTYESQ